MGNLGMTEILLLGAALLLFFGPSKLPGLGKFLGTGIEEFRKASNANSEARPDPAEGPMLAEFGSVRRLGSTSGRFGPGAALDSQNDCLNAGIFS